MEKILKSDHDLGQKMPNVNLAQDILCATMCKSFKLIDSLFFSVNRHT